MSLKNIAKDTLSILEEGKFINSSGITVQFATEQRAAEENTRLYTPEEGQELLQQSSANTGVSEPVIEVTDETTQVAAHRLVVEEGCDHLVLLNFASAKNPGGGFVNGAKAQEEDLARCSGLYPCLLKQPTYYETNRAQKSLLYTDHIIYSPNVPWFRTRSREILENFFLASVITAPAPNAGQFKRRNPKGWSEIETALRRRAGLVLAVAKDNGHRTVLLGAWGCGVFMNQPSMVADAFGQWLAEPSFGGYFNRVVFAVYDPRRDRGTFNAFRDRYQ